MGKKKDKKSKSQQEPVNMGASAIEIVSFARESTSPIVSERIQRNKPFVFWGEDNLYPNDLIRMADNSALHSAILDTKAKMIAGNGLIFDGTGGEDFFNKATEEFGGMSNLIDRVASDVSYFSSLSLNIQYDKGDRIGTIKHADTSYLRSGKMDIDSRKVLDYWHSTRWDIATNKRVYSKEDEIYKPVQILLFDPKKKREEISLANGQLITAKRYSPSVIYYAKPAYAGATNYIEVAAKIANFHKSQLDNGMVGNMHVHIKADLREADKRKKMLQELNEQYAGTNNAGRIVLTYGVGDANIPIITPLTSSDAHEQLSTLNEKVNQEIVSGHSIPRILTQLDQKTGLGGVETAEAIDMYQTLQITPEQKLIEDTLNEILKFNKINDTVKIEQLKPSTLILSDTLMKLSTTVDELREIRSEEPLEDKDKGGKLLIEIENDGKRSDTLNQERPS